MRVRVGIVGATGVVGERLIKLLHAHPQVDLVMVTSEHAAGKRLHDLSPALCGVPDLPLQESDPAVLAAQCDVVFLARKGPESMRMAPGLLEKECRVIDMGAVFRFPEAHQYEKAYGQKHLCPDVLQKAVYGLPELFRQEIRGASLVGNPGCYPTCVLLALAPLCQSGRLHDPHVLVDAYSGLSGAGRNFQERPSNLFIDCHDNIRAYHVFSHRHEPEMALYLSRIAAAPVAVDFIPHLMPAIRGIYASMTIHVSDRADLEDINKLYRDFYGRERFVKVMQDIQSVSLADVLGSNRCHLAVQGTPSGGYCILTAALDNLLKGAVGQAVQNMNLMFRLPEYLGLQDGSV